MFVREQALKNIVKTIKKVETDLPIRILRITFEDLKALISKKSDENETVPVLNKFLNLFQQGHDQSPNKRFSLAEGKRFSSENEIERKNSLIASNKFINLQSTDKPIVNEITRFDLTRGSLAISKLMTKFKKKPSKLLPVKFGDIIQIKFRFFESKGFIVGNGFATNSTKVSFDPATQLFQFRNSLFKIESSEEFMEHTSNIHTSSKSLFSRASRNSNSISEFIYYEDFIQLRHVESSKILTLLSTEIADEIGSLKSELSPESKGASFQVKGVGKAKGKIIMYGERITLQSSDSTDLYLHVEYCSEETQKLELEVNGRDEFTVFTLKLKQNLEEQMQGTNEVSEVLLKAHDFIRITTFGKNTGAISSPKIPVSISRIDEEELKKFTMILNQESRLEQYESELESKFKEYNPWCTWQIIPLEKSSNNFLEDKSQVALMNMSSSRMLASVNNLLVQVEEFNQEICTFVIKAKKSYNLNLVNDSYMLIQDTKGNLLTYSDEKFTFVPELDLDLEKDTGYFLFSTIEDDELAICLYSPSLTSELKYLIFEFQEPGSNKILLIDKLESLLIEMDRFISKLQIPKEIRQRVFDSYEIPMMIPLLLQYVKNPKSIIPRILELIEDNEQIANKIYSKYMEIMIRIIDQDTDCLISFIRSIGEVGDSMGIKKWAPVLEDYQDMSRESLISCSKHLQILGELLINNRGEAINKYQIALANYLEQARVGKLIMGISSKKVWVSFWRGDLAHSKLKENVDGLLGCDLADGFDLEEIDSSEVIDHINQWLIIYSRMTCNRCNETISVIESWGIKLKPLELILKSSSINPTLQASVLSLLESMYMDKYPFQRISAVKDYLFSTENILTLHRIDNLCELSMWQFLGDESDISSLDFLVSHIQKFWTSVEKGGITYSQLNSSALYKKTLEITQVALDFGLLSREMASKILSTICKNFDEFPISLANVVVSILNVSLSFDSRIIADLKEFHRIDDSFILLDDLPKITEMIHKSKFSLSVKSALMHYFFDYIDQREILYSSLLDRVHILPKTDIVNSFRIINSQSLGQEFDIQHLIKVLRQKKYIWNEMKALQFVISALSLQEKVEELLKAEIDIDSCLRFFILFVKDNNRFKIRMMTLIPSLLNISYNPLAVKLVIQIIRASKDFEINLSIVDTLMREPNRTNNLKILRGLILSDNHSDPNILLQKKILSNIQMIDFSSLIISPERIGLFEEVRFAGENSSQHLALMNQIEILRLLSATSHKNLLAKKFIRKFIIAEHLIKLLANPAVPYLYKAPLLRLYVEIFIFADPNESLVYLLWIMTLFTSLLKVNGTSNQSPRKNGKNSNFGNTLGTEEGIILDDNEFIEYLVSTDKNFLHDGILYVLNDILHICVEFPYEEVTEKQEDLLDSLKIFSEKDFLKEKGFETARSVTEVILSTFKITKRAEKAGFLISLTPNILNIPRNLNGSKSFSEEDDEDYGSRPDEWKKFRKELITNRISLKTYIARKYPSFFITRSNLSSLLSEFVSPEIIDYIFQTDELIPMIFVTRKLALNIWGHGKKIRDNPGGRPLEDTFTADFLLIHFQQRAEEVEVNEIFRVAQHIQENISLVIELHGNQNLLEIFRNSMEIFKEREEIWIGMMAMLVEKVEGIVEVIFESNVLGNILGMLGEKTKILFSTLELFNNILEKPEYQLQVYNEVLKRGSSFFPHLKKAIDESLQKENYIDLRICLKFIASASSNFSLEFQSIFRDQNFAFFTNFVQMLLQVLMILRQKPGNFEILCECLEALNCLVEGKNIENLKILRKDIKFIKLITEELKIEKSIFDEMSNPMLRYYSLLIILFDQIVQLDDSSKELTTMIPLSSLIEILKGAQNSDWFDKKYDIYEQRKICTPKKFIHKNCSDKCLKGYLELRDFLIFDLVFRISGFLNENMPLAWEKESNGLNWLRGEIGFVEINKDGVLFPMFFQRPSKHFLIQEDVKERIIFTAPKDSRSEKLKHLMKTSTQIIKELHFKQTISRILIFFYIVCYWRTIRYFNTFIVAIINILLIIGYVNLTNPTSGNVTPVIQDQESDPLMAFKIIHIILVIITLAGSIFERLPYLRYKPFESETINNIRLLRSSGNPDFRHKHQQFYHFLQELLLHLYETHKIRENWLLAIRLIIDTDIVYTFVYLGITIYAFQSNWPYTILLLDLAQSSRILRIVLNSVIFNWKSLFSVTLLILVVIYDFSIYGYLDLSRLFPSDEYDNSLKMSFLLSISPGIRTDGGVGNKLNRIPPSDHLYWKLYAFEMAFYSVIKLILLKILFGIIIQTFKQLRQELEEQEKEMQEKCYICGITKIDFDNKFTLYLFQNNELEVSYEPNSQFIRLFGIHGLLERERCKINDRT